MAAGEEPLDLNCGAGPKPWGLGEVFSHDGVSPYWTPEKHWGMQATKIIKVGSLILEEEPITAVSESIPPLGHYKTFSDLYSHVVKVVMPRSGRHHSQITCVDPTVLVVYELISKDHRNASCHFCFDMLPPDPMACFGCAIPIFCDEPCLSAACDESSKELDGHRWRGEHMHECFGMSWSAVLPTDVVMAARLFARGQGNARLDRQVNELGHHYDKLSGAAKVEVHVLGTIMAHCLSYHPTNNFELSMGELAAKLSCVKTQ